MTVMPAVAHNANAGELILADSAAYAEHTVAGYTFGDDPTVSGLAARFDTLRAESFRASEKRGNDRRARGDMGTWRKSSYSDANGGSCVEVADNGGIVLVRDTTDRGGAASGTSPLPVPAESRATFTRKLRG